MNPIIMLSLLSLSRHERTATRTRKSSNTSQGSGCPYTINELRQMHGLPPLQPRENENREEERKQ